jgi:hypothetical protein
MERPLAICVAGSHTPIAQEKDIAALLQRSIAFHVAE